MTSTTCKAASTSTVLLISPIIRAETPTPLGEAPAQPVGETGETRRFNAEQRVLLRLLLAIEEAELSRSEATRLVERITDFVDPDRNPRIEGAEDERYLSSAFPYRAPNRPLASVSELRPSMRSRQSYTV